jgi:hypothetical protein
MAADLASAVAAPLARAVIGFFQVPKGEQHLDPIATLFTLAMRDMTEYENAKPAVQQNYLYFDKATAYQKASRTLTWSKVSNGDLSFIAEPLKLFTKWWQAKECDKLVPITEHAISSLQKIGAMYKADYPNVPPLMEYYVEILSNWINDKAPPKAPPEVPAIAPSSEPPKDSSIQPPIKEIQASRGALTIEPAKIPPLMSKIKELWSKELMESFYTLYNKNDCSTLESMMLRTRTQYQELLKNPGAKQ